MRSVEFLIKEAGVPGFQTRTIDNLSALGLQGPFKKKELVEKNYFWAKILKVVPSGSYVMAANPNEPRHSPWISPEGGGLWMVGAEDGYMIKQGPSALKFLNDLLRTDEAWSQKYKKSINCDNPKGFSQRAHCAGRRKNESIEENFADGKKPGRKGLAKRMRVPTKASVSRLRKIAKNSSGEKQRMAHFIANMKAGRKKNK
jgi:hypothetical protein